MSWSERIREAAYTSPSGTRLVFLYEDVSKSFDKKTTAFEFPDADGTYVQDLGHTGRRYPLRVFFWGADYDIQANLLEELLKERGTGLLEHPMYGAIDVVPFGSITRRDDLKTAANQAVFEITFFETIGLIYPTAQVDPVATISQSTSDYETAAAEQFEEYIKLDTVAEKVAVKTQYQTLLDNTRATLDQIAASESDLKERFDDIVDSIQQSIDVFISEPLDLAFQTLILLKAPARAKIDIEARLDAYKNLANYILTGEVEKPSFDKRAANRFHTRDVFATGALSAKVAAATSSNFVTKTEAIETAESLLVDFDQLNEWRESNFISLDEIDTGEAYKNLQNSVALAAGYLVEISFSLKQERAIVLDRDRTIIDLCAEIYSIIDDELDFLINSNELSGSEILELKRGRRIVYYV